MRELLNLFFSFFKIGLFTFGGGYAMLPMLEKECVEKHKWITSDDLLDYFAIAQCTPGVIAVNTATFVGKKQKGVSGAVFSTLGVVFPSLLIILLLASVIQMFQNNEYVLKAFAGIRIAVCALIFKSIVNISKKALIDFKTVLFALLAFITQIIALCSPSLTVVMTILFGYIYYLFSVRQNGGKS